MFRLIRQHIPLVIGCATTIIAIDLIVLLYRGLGLQKDAAVYVAVLTFTAAASLLVRISINRK